MVRERFGGTICIIPGLGIVLIGNIFQNDAIIALGIITGFVGIFFSSQMYYLFLYDSNSPCAIYAGNMALQYGFSPKAQNGKMWNPRNFRISEIYEMYPNDRQEIPREGTAGFMFYTNRKGTFARRVEFYDYRMGGKKLVYYEFFFHSIESYGDKLTRKEIFINEIPACRRFVALEKL